MREKVLWWVLLIGFVEVNLYAVVASDLGGLLAFLGNLGPWGLLAVTDLLIALTIGIVWMWRDAQRKGVTPWPYALLTLATGSVGLLVYLVRHGGTRAASAA